MACHFLSEKGATAVEYTCMLSMVLMVCIASLAPGEEGEGGIGVGTRESISFVAKSINRASRLPDPGLSGGGGGTGGGGGGPGSGGSEGTVTLTGSSSSSGGLP